MIKKVFGLILMILSVFGSCALADVVTLFDGHYEIFGKNVSFEMTYLISSIFIFIIALIGIIMVTKKAKSKKGLFIALIVVAFILLVLILPAIMPEPEISHGMRYMPTMSAQEVMTFNAEFKNYIGKEKTPSDVRSLISQVEVHNANKEEVDKYGLIALDGIDELNKIDNAKRYEVSVGEYDFNGLISIINIIEEQ